VGRLDRFRLTDWREVNFLRESYREGGRVRKRTLANLSKLPRALIDGIARRCI
jgi:hypothetical protein